MFPPSDEELFELFELELELFPIEETFELPEEGLLLLLLLLPPKDELLLLPLEEVLLLLLFPPNDELLLLELFIDELFIDELLLLLFEPLEVDA